MGAFSHVCFVTLLNSYCQPPGAIDSNGPNQDEIQSIMANTVAQLKQLLSSRR